MWHMEDIWVNWFDGSSKGYEVCEFHEWKSTDNIGLMFELICLKVKPEFFDYVENGCNKLPKDLIATVENESEKKDHDGDYETCNAFAITDGKRILVVDPEETDIPLLKSRMIPRHEEHMLRIAEGHSVTKFEFDPVEEDMEDPLNPPALLMAGLTRQERRLKKLLTTSIIASFEDISVERAKYWFGEWDYEKRHEVEGKSYEEIMGRLFLEVSVVGWSENHLNLLKTTAKYDKFIGELLTEYLEGAKK
ncbi:YjbA family protein [Priestia megaterium]|uniref:YjbA family protein n=1 Tax=Priestia megaterium TaxID=1404 RepID=UPI00211C23DE|nr:YjbA family protein [Priestia megaterium]